nr:hypothetical protein [Methylobacterium sp. ZNC0032]
MTISTACNCAEDVDTKLAEHNTRLLRALVFRPPGERLIIETEIVEKKRGARPVSMFPSFCPFCGTKYPEAEAG